MLPYRTQLLRAICQQTSRPRTRTHPKLSPPAYRNSSHGPTDEKRQTTAPRTLDELSREHRISPQVLQAYLELDPHSRKIVMQEIRDTHSKRRQPRKYKFVIGLVSLCVVVGLFRYACEPPQDHNLFSQILDESVSRIIPPKQVEPPYVQYQPITRDKEIRLLILEPGTGDAEIRCRLVHVQPSWRTRYEALSYAWGDASDTREIECSGTTRSVPTNLHSALTDLRHPTRERILWTDNLCINQDDNEEKAKQIILMRDIYSQAQQVLIHLGSTDPSDDRAMQIIRELDHKFKWAYLLNDLGWGWLQTPFKENEVGWDQIIRLLSRPWFLRTWVIQEIVLARKALVVCGDQSIPWPMLQRVIFGMEQYRNATKAIPDFTSIEDVVSAVRLMASIRIAHHGPSHNISTWLCSPFRLGEPAPAPAHDDPKLLDLIWESRTSKCGMPGDKIFGMLGMTGQNTNSKYLIPNYTISTEDVFRNFVLWEILCNNSLRVLKTSSDKDNGQFEGPSWVPNFDRLNVRHGISGADSPDSFDASAGSSPQARVSNLGSVLYLKGKIVDTLHTVGQRSVTIPPILGIYGSEERYGNTPEWYQSFQVNKEMTEEARDIWITATSRATKGLGPIPKASEILPLLKEGTEYKELTYDDNKHTPSNWEPFLRTLLCDRGLIGQRYLKYPNGFNTAAVASFVRVALQGTDLPRWFRKHNGYGAHMMQNSFLQAARSRRFAGTEKGLIGWAPMRAKEGDLVCILYGADLPFVMRKAAGGKYVLVGECYMHGIMYGEALEMADVKDREVEFAIV